MKNKIKGILTVAILSTVMVSGVVASGHSQKIDVVMNSINIRVNGKSMEQDNILYEGTTYIPLRAAGEILDMEVAWDQETKVASIFDGDDTLPHRPILIGSKEFDKPKSQERGSFENPVGIPSTAVLAELSQFREHLYDYRLNLPGGGYIEKVIYSEEYDPHVTIYGEARDNDSFNMSVYLDGSVRYTYFGYFEMPDLTDEANGVVKYEARRFLEAYGH